MVGGADPLVRPGEVVSGRYKVLRTLGQGGMGVVVQAQDCELGRRVALKLMLPKASRSSVSRERFVREARVAVRLQSPHVAQVYDVGTFEHEEMGATPFIVMELLKGQDVGQVLKDRGPLPVEDAVEIILHACEAVGEAHAHDVIHRDLKPANLFLTRGLHDEPCVKVLDFGISKLADDEHGSRSITETGGAMGTPHYMSPEQMRSAKHVDERADVWSLGVMLYEFLTCELPFDADNATELVAAVLETKARPITDLRADLDPDLVSVIECCLANDPDDRFDDVDDLAVALAAFAPPRAQSYGDRVTLVMTRAASSRELEASETVPASVGRPAASGTLSQANWDAVPEESPTKTRRFAAVTIGVLALGLGVGLITSKRGTEPPAQASSATAAVEVPADTAEEVPADETAQQAPSASASAQSPQASASAQPAEPATPARPSKPGPQTPRANNGQPSTIPQPPPAPASTRPDYCSTALRFYFDEGGGKVLRPECQ